MVSDTQSMIFAVLLVGSLLGACACLVNNFVSMSRTHKWYTLHMPLLPDSSNLRLDAALRDAEEGFNVCLACGFENLKRNIFCTICGSPVECPEDGQKKKKKSKDKLHEERQRLSATLNRRRQARARKRKEWVRKVDVEGKLFWFRDANIGTETQFPGYVLQFRDDPLAVKKAEKEEEGETQASMSVSDLQPEGEPRDVAHVATTNEEAEIVITIEGAMPTGTLPASGVQDGDEETLRRSIVVDDESAEDDDESNETEPTDDERRQKKQQELELSSMEDVNRRLVDEIARRPKQLVESVNADPARAALNDSTETDLHDDAKVLADHAQLDFPTKMAEFVTRTSTVLVPADQSLLKVKIRRDDILQDSIETLAATPERFARCTIRMAFIGEQGIDAGGVYREWLVQIYEKIVSRKAGIFKCVDSKDRTFYLNPMSQRDIGEDHLAYFYATGRLLGRALLEGNVTGFHLSLPLLKILLGQPVTFSDLEYFDPAAYKSMLWLLDNDGVAELGLDFTATQQSSKGETVVVELIPGGRNIDVTDENKFEYVDCKLKYLLFDSVSSQLFAFLKGFHEVMPPEMLMMFDAEELDYILSGSDEIDVDDWERNSKYTSDLIEHPVREWFWDLVREMPNEYRRRLLLFCTGSSRVPLAGFGALTSYDGRLCPFTLKGVDMEDEGGYIRSHACFNRLDLPRYNLKSKLKAVLYAVLDTELTGRKQLVRSFSVGEEMMLTEGFARVRKTARLAGAVRTHSSAQRLASFNGGGKRSVSYILGIETSCDDTAVAVVDSTGNVLSNVVSSQWELNAKWKGIVPALAARAHEENLPHVLEAAIQQSGLSSISDLSAVAVTSGPGLSPCLGVGLATAQQLAIDHSIDFLQINHLEAHVLVARLPSLDLPSRPEFPFLVLLVSGGHCCLVLARGIGDYELLGNTLDDSVGEAYDKVARMLELTAENPGVHGGKLIEDLAKKGNDRAFPFSEPMTRRPDCDFSYSGIKTAMLRELRTLETPLSDETKAGLCASFQRRAVDQLVRRTRRACEWGRDRVGTSMKHLVVCGGVASNQYLRERIQEAGSEEGLHVVFPPAKLCTDNGVMIAWAGVERYELGMRSEPVGAKYRPRWPLDTLEPLNSQ